MTTTPINTTTKTCNLCNEDKPVTEFSPVKRGKFGVRAVCKICIASAAKENRRLKKENNPEEVKLQRRVDNLKRFRLTPESWQKMYDDQDGVCSICGGDGIGSGRWDSLHVDHDHSCCPGKGTMTCGECNRGLLCSKCNTMLGLVQDDEDRLLSAINYLQTWKLKTRGEK